MNEIVNFIVPHCDVCPTLIMDSGWRLSLSLVA
jgi:hypothetical protein